MNVCTRHFIHRNFFGFSFLTINVPATRKMKFEKKNRKNAAFVVVMLFKCVISLFNRKNDISLFTDEINFTLILITRIHNLYFIYEISLQI